MQLLFNENLDVVSETRAIEYLEACKISTTIEHLAINSCFGIYCGPSKSTVLCHLLKERSRFLKAAKDEKGSTYVLEKLFKDFNFYRPSDVMTCYSEEALTAYQHCDLKTARLYLAKLIKGIRDYGAELHKDLLRVFEKRIGNYIMKTFFGVLSF